MQLLQGVNLPLEPLIRQTPLGELQGIYAQINRGVLKFGRVQGIGSLAVVDSDNWMADGKQRR